MVGPKKPVIFLKSWSSINYNPKKLYLPRIDESSLSHEIELGVMIKGNAYRIKKEDAMRYIGCYFILIDTTDGSQGRPGDYVP